MTTDSLLPRAKRPTVILGIYALVVVVKLALHLLAFRYDHWFRDEFYYLACSYRLEWSYVDHPSASIAFLALLGEGRNSLAVVRIVVALIGCATLCLAGCLTRQLGGNAIAQALAMAAILFSPGFLALHSFYSMNAWEPLLWLVAAGIWVRLAERDELGLWGLLALVLAVGLHNKLSMLWFALPSLALGVLAFHGRRDVPRGTAAVLLTLIVAAVPIFWWQASHGWPTLEFMSNATRMKVVDVSPVEFWLMQLVVFGPLVVMLGAIGAGALLLSRRLRARGIVLGGSFLATSALLSLSTGVRAYYLAPAYAIVVPAGAVAVCQIAQKRLSRGITTALATALFVVSFIGIPLALPVLSPEATIQYASVLRLPIPREERFGSSELPQHLADRHGWQEMARTVAEAIAVLPASVRSHLTLIAANYGEAGALEYYRPAYGLPERIASPHNHYWFWAKPETWGVDFVTIGFPLDALTSFCAEKRELTRVNCQWCRAGEKEAIVAYCRYGGSNLTADWQRLRRFL